jgi:hypothetical protein
VFRWCVTDVTFSDGSEIAIPKDGIVLLVGPNNVGKSRALRDMSEMAQSPVSPGTTIKDIKFQVYNLGELADWMRQSLPRYKRDGQDVYQVQDQRVGLQDLQERAEGHGLRFLAPNLVLYADGSTRLHAGHSTATINFDTDEFRHPLHRLHQNLQLEKELDARSREALQTGVVLDRWKGSLLTLLIGEKPADDFTEGVPSDAYRDKLKELKPLEDHGDGIKAYLGLLLTVIAGRQQIILIDEPEAFLHPPQSRRLGRVLAERAMSLQVIVATHSSDFLRGALEGSGPTTIIRITREGNVNHAAALRDSDVAKLWADPLLRYSNILDGLFHDAVILCESDSDCRYYQAVLDALGGAGLDLLFTHCSTKDRFPKIIDALDAVRVPVVAVSDFDVLRDEAKLRQIVASLGGDFGTIARDLAVVRSGLASQRPLLKLNLIAELNRRLRELPDQINEKQAHDLRGVVKAESGWDMAKRAGIEALPQGDSADAGRRLLDRLKDIGLLVVPVGELERFAPEVSGHGPPWVVEVLERGLHKSPSDKAKSFVEMIRDAANAAASST